MPDILQLIINQSSPDNNVRRSSELEFNQVVKSNPSESFYLILEASINNSLPIDLRQSCLLNLKRLVPQFWSLGFNSFIGPPITQDLKNLVRSKLLQLTITTDNSKLRNSAAYAIVQIASVDYPDEWPELMNVLYQSTTDFSNVNSMLGGLQVLTDLFDDLITEEQFWEGGVGIQVCNHLDLIFKNVNIEISVKNQALKLYENVLAILRSPEAFENSKRKQFTISQINITLEAFINLISITGNNLIELQFKSNLFKVISLIIGQFHHRIPRDVKLSVLKLTLETLHLLSPIYNDIALDTYQAPLYSELEALSVVGELIYYIFHTIASIQSDIPIAEIIPIPQFLNDSVICTALAKTKVEEYENDINVYVSEITGLSVDLNPRDAILDLWGELNEADVRMSCNALIDSFDENDKRILEAQLFTLQGILSNDCQLPEVPLKKLLSFITYEYNLVTSDCFLLLPKYFENFMEKEAINVFNDMLKFAEKSNDAIIKISTLVSCTYYQHVFEFSSLNKEAQLILIKIAESLIDECEDDGLPTLLEAITQAISINPANAATLKINPNVSVIDLIFIIAFKDPANVQLISEASESLSTLLKNINMSEYMKACEDSLPFIFERMQESNGEYTPQLYLSLELLSIIIQSAPGDDLPSQVFEYAFPILKNILLISNDNQILQSGGEVFNELIQKGSKLFLEYQNPTTKESGIESMMQIVNKFLSPELSDSAANKCGIIVLSLINKFQDYLSPEILTRLLEATVNRLIISKESTTIENLIMVFCQLVLKSPKETINFLAQITINNKSGLQTILPIWFDSYEVTRGFEQIKQNSLALGQIFSLGDPRIENLIVNGEIIPYEGEKIITRSMAKTMPDKYTQISASLKILKLLVGELQFQCQQPNAGDYLPEEEDEDEEDETHPKAIQENDNLNEDDDEGWEDMEDIGVPNFAKLKSYVEDNEKDLGGDNSLKNLLIEFFKECTSKNLGNFGIYYEELNENEKRLISECLIF
ncbi:uncharacterized protein KGF55_004951 [Candida pseudojiufengensis]|uniref:uncharacterized protein n=1 Tax=Candida pseudojiufengensis TaxID=497109 RepID=UPI0022244837|nr:uncharacterized protein KGF55_004951 [Candida pseudojiufengensis]KAI5959719.1 hypothetical protein KGF55_004951 [Candida pseudojiufengensis]